MPVGVGPSVTIGPLADHDVVQRCSMRCFARDVPETDPRWSHSGCSCKGRTCIRFRLRQSRLRCSRKPRTIPKARSDSETEEKQCEDQGGTFVLESASAKQDAPHLGRYTGEGRLDEQAHGRRARTPLWRDPYPGSGRCTNSVTLDFAHPQALVNPRNDSRARNHIIRGGIGDRQEADMLRRDLILAGANLVALAGTAEMATAAPDSPTPRAFPARRSRPSRYVQSNGSTRATSTPSTQARAKCSPTRSPRMAN